jgi:phage terminase small subunit
MDRAGVFGIKLVFAPETEARNDASEMKLHLAKSDRKKVFMTRNTRPQPIVNPLLTAAKSGADLKQRLFAEFDLSDSATLAILDAAGKAYDTMLAAQKLVDLHGVCVKDRWGQLRTNPATTVLRDSRAAFLRGLQMLNLDLEPLQPGAGRPRGK